MFRYKSILIIVLFIGALNGAQSARASIPLAIVSHHWQEIIVESNHAALRTGSVYDILTYFEQNLGFPQPTFKYLFHDTGLGAAEPIYPIFQQGFQESWQQLIAAGLSDQVRHIDHYSTGETPEGCIIKSTYWVRHINEFPDLYADERAAGYTLVDISFDYYIKKTPDAQCGKHRAHDVPPDYDPFEQIKPYASTFKTLTDIPPELLEQYEAKIGILKLIKQEFSSTKWPRFDDVYTLRGNSLWYYPDGFKEAYGLTTPRPQKDLPHLNKPLQLLIPASPEMESGLKISRLIGWDGFQKVLDFLNGKPTPDFDPKTEPGHDAFNLSQVGPKNFYTSGIDTFPIRNVVADVSDPSHYRLVSALVRPYEPEADVAFPEPVKIPQLRFVFQLSDPRNPRRAYEQVFIHLMFDAVDRDAPKKLRDEQRDTFLKDLDTLTALREGTATPVEKEQGISDFLDRYTRRPVQTISFSSSLTGIWAFGSLSRNYNLQRNLEAVRIVHDGVDYGYYSSAYDTVLLREAAAAATGDRQVRLNKILEDLLPNEYRDVRRQDVHALSFNRISCAQCHQMSGRDGVHMQLNDHLDRRITTPYRATEYFFRELDRQLVEGPGE